MCACVCVCVREGENDDDDDVDDVAYVVVAANVDVAVVVAHGVFANVDPNDVVVDAALAADPIIDAASGVAPPKVR